MERARGLGLGLLSAALFGMATPLSKDLLAALPPTILAGLLYLGAAAALLPVVARRGASLPSDRANRLRLGGAVLFGGVLGPVLLLSGLMLTPAATVSMLLSLETLATAVLAVVLFREHLGGWAWSAVVGMVVSGSLLGAEGGLTSIVGPLLVVGACVAWGLDNNLTAVIDGITPTGSTFWKGLVAGITNLAFGAIVTPAPWSAAWPWALAIGAVSYGISITLYIQAAQLLGATRSQMVFATAPLFGVAVAVLWLGERLNGVQLGAAALLAGSLVMLFFDRHSHRHVHEAVVHRHSHRHDDGHHQHAHPGLPASSRHSASAPSRAPRPRPSALAGLASPSRAWHGPRRRVDGARRRGPRPQRWRVRPRLPPLPAAAVVGPRGSPS